MKNGTTPSGSTTTINATKATRILASTPAPTASHWPHYGCNGQLGRAVGCWAFGYDVIKIPIAAGALSAATGWRLSPVFASAALWSPVAVFGDVRVSARAPVRHGV